MDGAGGASSFNPGRSNGIEKLGSMFLGEIHLVNRVSCSSVSNESQALGAKSMAPLGDILGQRQPPEQVPLRWGAAKFDISRKVHDGEISRRILMTKRTQNVRSKMRINVCILILLLHSHSTTNVIVSWPFYNPKGTI